MTAGQDVRAGRSTILWLAVAAVLLIAAALAIAGGGKPQPLPARDSAERPRLLLVTSLPLVFAETFTLENSGSPALKALERRYSVEPIGIADADSLGTARLLLMAHPRAQTAEALVELDAWVRSGGRLLLLADPKLDWPSKRPLGDILRPPLSYADTGLLRHWGLELYAPETDGLVTARIGGRSIELLSPGTLAGSCPIGENSLIARCSIGRGRVTVIADADLLDVAEDRSDNLEWVLAELNRLERN